MPLVSPHGYPELLRGSASETVPLLLALARAQAQRRRPAELLEQMDRDRFVHPSFLDQRTLHRLDGLALDSAPEFEAVQLSPVTPLGTCSVLAPSSQDRTLTTMRGTEVVSDPTNTLALICAQRLRRNVRDPVRLCTVHQVLRAQALPPRPGFSRHFRLFVLAEAGLGQAEDQFELDAIGRHLQSFDRLCEAAKLEFGCRFPGRKFVLKTSPRRAVLRDRLVRRLQELFPHVTLEVEEFESSYYDGLRVIFGADTNTGEFCLLADLGLFDWAARMLSNRKVRFVASGLGTQLLPALFTAPPAANDSDP